MGTVLLIVAIVVLVLALAVVLRQMPEIRRYRKIRSM
jgi:hypothetical protein